jgi:hypothetical protein
MYANGKMIPVEIVPGMGERRDKGEWWRGWIHVWYIWYIVRISVNVTKFPHPAQHKKRGKNKKIWLKGTPQNSKYMQIVLLLRVNEKGTNLEKSLASSLPPPVSSLALLLTFRLQWKECSCSPLHCRGIVRRPNLELKHRKLYARVQGSLLQFWEARA